METIEYKYYDNSATCGNCNGSGLQGYMDYCRECGRRAMPALAGYGRTRFPLSHLISGCKPPAIEKTYARKFARWEFGYVHPKTYSVCGQ